MFGKSTNGSNYWYSDWNTKIGTVYHTQGETIDRIYARYGSGYATSTVKACVYDATTRNLVAVSNEVIVSDTELSWHEFLMPTPITLPAGTYVLCLIIGTTPDTPWGAAINFGFDITEIINGIQNSNIYTDGPSSVFEASDANAPVQTYKDFDIYATESGALPYPPSANFNITPPGGKSGDTTRFDASSSTQGWTGNTFPPIVTYNWDFGDGTTGQGITIDHTFTTTEEETFNVKLTIIDAEGIQVETIKPYSIFIPKSTLNINFEKPAHFAVGTGTLWEPSSWPLLNPNNKFEPELGLPMPPGITGNTVAKLALLNPATTVTSDGYRLEILHRLHPINNFEMELEAWIYIPSNYPMNSQRCTLFRPIYERCWLNGASQWFNGFHMGLWLDSYRQGRPTYMKQVFIISTEQGEVLGGGNVQEDVIPSDTDPTMMPVFNQWFFVKSYVKRDVNNWSNGVARMWIALPPDYQLKLVYERNPCRTIGIDPALILQASDRYLQEGYFCSGFSNYIDPTSPPTTVYFKDIVLTGNPLDVLNPRTVTFSVNNPIGNGTTDLPTGTHEFNIGATITINAIPSAGYAFKKWQLDGMTYMDNPLQLSITEDLNGKTLTAEFELISPTPIVSPTLPIILGYTSGLGYLIWRTIKK